MGSHRASIFLCALLPLYLDALPTRNSTLKKVKARKLSSKQARQLPTLFSRRIPLSSTDAAGVLFFANAFRFAHDLYEEICLEDKGLKKIFNHSDFIVPIVHAEADYLHPLKAFETFQCRLDVIHLGGASFKSQVSILKKSKVCVVVRLIHVFVDKKTGKSMPIPPKIKNALSQFVLSHRKKTHAG
jgi:acyl-CoA thioesterase FadM